MNTISMGRIIIDKVIAYINKAREMFPEVTDDMLCGNGAIYYMNGNDGTEFDWIANNMCCEKNMEGQIMYNPVCEYCHKELGEGNFKTFALAYKAYNSKAKRSLFCNEECYKAYIKQFEVEEYKNNSIYMVEVNGEKRYMPYWFSPYYFTTIEDCRKRIDSPTVGICSTFFN